MSKPEAKTEYGIMSSTPLAVILHECTNPETASEDRADARKLLNYHIVKRDASLAKLTDLVIEAYMAGVLSERVVKP